MKEKGKKCDKKKRKQVENEKEKTPACLFSHKKRVFRDTRLGIDR